MQICELFCSTYWYLCITATKNFAFGSGRKPTISRLVRYLRRRRKKIFNILVSDCRTETLFYGVYIIDFFAGSKGGGARPPPTFRGGGASVPPAPPGATPMCMSTCCVMRARRCYDQADWIELFTYRCRTVPHARKYSGSSFARCLQPMM